MEDILFVVIALILLAGLVFFFLFIRINKVNKTLEAENNNLKGRVETLNAVENKIAMRLDTLNSAADKIAAYRADIEENGKDSRKPLTVKSIWTALRINGISPEILDTHEPYFIHFKKDDVRFRIQAKNLPYILISTSFSLDEPEENYPLLSQAASVISYNMYVVKASLVDGGKGVAFSAEFIADYVYLRNNLQEYIGILIAAIHDFFEIFEHLRQQATEKSAISSDENIMLNSKTIPS